MNCAEQGVSVGRSDQLRLTTELTFCPAFVFGTMKEIQLSQGLVAIVDDKDFEELNKFKWCASKSGGTFYAVRSIFSNGKRSYLKMHRVILGINDPKMVCDHKDGNGINNQRSNLRVCAQAQNVINKRKSTANSSGYKGVHFNKERKKFQGYIAFASKHIYLGCFECPVEAAIAYDLAAIKLHGEFAKPNFACSKILYQSMHGVFI